jgi:transcriptional regulator with PAS, ATPase and Fis domain
LASFVGSSPAAVEVKRHARRAAQSSSPVLLLGETGTGKELLAHAIHASSARAQGPFVSVNIAAVPDTLLEAEFFGVAPGAYTGADRKGRDGKFKLADGGTLFLDEIGDMPLGLQPKLLRAAGRRDRAARLQQARALRCARDRRHLARPAALVRRRQVPRRPLLPPQRAADARAAAARTPQRHPRAGRGAGRRHGAAQRQAPFELTPDALALLASQHWRGNIRELRNVLEQAAMRSDSQRIDAVQLERILREAGLEQIELPDLSHANGDEEAALLRPLAQQVAELERKAIAAAMASTGGNKLATSRLLGISRATLYERMTSQGQSS